ncbi:hypothetical protein [Azonexus sp.]|uniref:hypothetical protein n=1 Tax=Azonexus sp. TaxID=1872668 RepID=UPI0039E55B64
MAVAWQGVANDKFYLACAALVSFLPVRQGNRINAAPIFPFQKEGLARVIALPKRVFAYALGGWHGWVLGSRCS